MNTMLVGLRTGTRHTNPRTWPANSPPQSLPRKPMPPPAQNTQPSAQPACDPIGRAEIIHPGVARQRDAILADHQPQPGDGPPMCAGAVSTFPRHHEIERDGVRDLGAHSQLVISPETVRERNPVPTAHNDAIP